jgi:predicted GNAT family N-acyltransferase
MSIRINKVDSELELAHVFEIRREVFVDEQDCPPELEWEFEEESTHFLARLDELPVGAARWRKTEKGYKLERFAVAMAYRGKGVGQALVAAVLADLPEEATYVYLHAQVNAMGLYSKFGFLAEGPQFEEAGIQHFKMVLKG